MLYSNILVAFDGSKASNKALDHAISMLQVTPDAKISIIHVFGFPRVYFGESYAPISTSVTKEYYDLAEQTVETAKQRLKDAGVTGTVELIQGAPAEVILDYSKKNNFDVIIIGSRGLGGIREFVLGSVSHNVVQHARIPVLVVK